MPFTELSTSEKIIIRVNVSVVSGLLSTKFKDICQASFFHSPRQMHLDLSAVNYLDSVFIGSFLYAIKLLKERDMKVHIDATSESVRSLLKSLLIDRFIVM